MEAPSAAPAFRDEQLSAKFAEDVGCPVDEYGITATLECLRGKEAADLAAKQYNVKDVIQIFWGKHALNTTNDNFKI